MEDPPILIVVVIVLSSRVVVVDVNVVFDVVGRGRVVVCRSA